MSELSQNRNIPLGSDAAKLIASVRNEINNPLAALLGQTQLLLREDLSEKVRRRAETIESQAKRIQEIVSKLRTVYKSL